MATRTVAVVLTVPQAEALWSAARYVCELDPAGDGPDDTRLRVLLKARGRLHSALDLAYQDLAHQRRS